VGGMSNTKAIVFVYISLRYTHYRGKFMNHSKRKQKHCVAITSMYTHRATSIIPQEFNFYSHYSKYVHSALLESRGNPDVMLNIARALLNNSPNASEINEATTLINK
jgi:hypothetical protein